MGKQRRKGFKKTTSTEQFNPKKAEADKKHRKLMMQYQKMVKSERHQRPRKDGQPVTSFQQRPIMNIKQSAIKRAQEDFNRKKQQATQEKEDQAKKREQRERALEKYNKKKKDKFSKIQKRTKKGQVLMKSRMELLLQSIKKQQSES